MTNVDKIGFNFNAMDEAFVRNLYVGWDNFYRDAFEAVVDEFLSRHNEEGRLLRLDKLELNLGSIPQDNFYLQFPVRLREELERVFLFQSAQIGARESLVDQIKRRLACLKFYLEKGFCPTEWEEAEFELEKEMRFLLPFAPASIAHLFHESIRQPNQLYRLKWNISNELFGHLMLFWLEDKSISRKEKEQRYAELRNIDSNLEPSLHRMLDSVPLLSEKLSALLSDDEEDNSMSWLLNTNVSVYEKRRILSGMLEWQPIVIIRYIHEIQDENRIRSLAALLDKIMVRQIINVECEDHTEADVPVYWMYLYNWLLKYYPFNGIYMFGNKLQFQEYLNVKLLQFIRKRSYSAFLSKSDITVQFLIEVFGQEYYLEVLNIIYNQQTRNEDGSPVYTDYLNMELYYMFLHLSLLKVPVQPDKRTAELIEILSDSKCPVSIQKEIDTEKKKDTKKPLSSASPDREELTGNKWDEDRLEAWLRNPDIRVDVKRFVIHKYIMWQPERMLIFVHRLMNKQLIFPHEWANWMDEDDLIHMIAGFSLSKAELLEQIIVYLRQKELFVGNDIRIGVLQFLAEKELRYWLRENSTETVKRFIRFISQENNEVSIQQKLGKEEIIPMIMKVLLIKDMEEENMNEKRMDEPEYVNVGNAGLALLAPWFPRLFTMLDMLNEKKTDFKNLESRIRAVFIIQRLVTFDDREYRESDLAFNRILVGCPFYEPLPKMMKLEEEELQVIESMLNGVKGNWAKVQNISIQGFQHNFIERSGHLEQKEEKWLLTVDIRAFDMLLDSVPWSYSRIQFPWLPLPIQVSWRNKHDF